MREVNPFYESKSVDDYVNCLVLIKGRERYVITFDDSPTQTSLAIRSAARFAI